MVFSSLPFLFLFLTVVLLVSHILPFRFRNFFLLLANLVFYAYGEPVYVLIMIGSILVNFFAGLLMDKQSTQGRRRAVLVVGIVLNLAALGVFKYAGLFVSTLREIPGLSSLPEVDIALPIGISFYTFQAVSYLIDVYWDDCAASHNLINFASYISLFPQLIAGPIVRYADVAPQLDSRTTNWNDFADGLSRFLVGLGKKVLLANQFGALIRAFRASESQSVLFYWVYALAFTLHIYFDFSGYSDMAIGLSRMFGFTFPENFRYPYAALGIKDFWRRWHISLSGWFRDYLYIPLGGNRKGKVRTWLNQLIVFFCTGLWHGANVTFIVWGLFHGALLIAESSGLLNVRKWRFKGLAHMYTLLMVTVGFVIFRADTMGDAWLYLKAMFTSWSVGGVTLRQAVGYLTPYFLLLTAAAALACTPVWPRLQEAARRRAETGGGDGLARAVRAGSYALSGAALLLCLFALATDSYNPFIYFRF